MTGTRSAASNALRTPQAIERKGNYSEPHNNYRIFLRIPVFNEYFAIVTGLGTDTKKGIIKMKKYLLFDLDGTLTDPKIGITTCVQYALHSFGIEEPDLDKLEPFIGPPLRDSFMEFYSFTAEQAEEAVAKYRERFQNTGIFENEVYAGIPEMLKNLQSKGYFLALASSKPQIYVERILEHFDLKKYFAVVVGSELDGTRETKDQVVQETLHQLFKENPIEPDQVYMIGDRKFDVEGARALGVESVGVTYGYGSKEELKEAKADYIVQSVEELEKFLLRGSEELVNSNPDNKKKNPMYQRIWTMVYSFLMFILVRNAVQYALLALLYQLAQSGASGGLVDLLILRDETGAYNGYSGDVSSIIAALGFIGGALAVWSTAKLLITKNKEVRDAVMKFCQARLSPPLIGQIAAEASLDAPEEYSRETYDEYVERRKCLIDGLNRIPGVYSPIPMGAFYTVAKLPVDDSDKFCAWCLSEFEYEGQTVFMAPASGFYTTPGSGKNEVRIAYVLKKEDLTRALFVLQKALEAYPGRTE